MFLCILKAAPYFVRTNGLLLTDQGDFL